MIPLPRIYSYFKKEKFANIGSDGAVLRVPSSKLKHRTQHRPLAGIGFLLISFRKKKQTKKDNNTNSQMTNMHSFSIQDKTVTFQYENALLHVSISQRSLINTPVLKSENTLYQSNTFVFDGRV